jgi:hypothetical protein
MMAQTEVDTGMALLLSVEAMIHYPAVQMFPVRRATLLVKFVIITTMSPFDDCMKFPKSPKSLRSLQTRRRHSDHHYSKGSVRWLSRR